MKKFLLLTLLLVVLAACGNKDEETSSQPEEPAKSTESETESEKANEKVEAPEEETSDEKVDTETQDTSAEVTAESSPLKVQYLNELTALEEEIENKPEGETQIEMEEIAAETYKIWDDELNKIWKELEKQLPTDEMDKLREEQRGWIKEKYKITSEEAAQYEGGTMEALVKVNTQARVTKERCYELVEKYM
ncbi:lysozyme inhibitor LprI family protein [Bacillus sp. JJ1533]|uniref:lysozyme inhibitor LprI family protein n=1 Tax=Bacillus sp. JJ1533 TaxID=3122959 RepID=UPI002FFFF66C